MVRGCLWGWESAEGEAAERVVGLETGRGVEVTLLGDGAGDCACFFGALGFDTSLSGLDAGPRDTLLAGARAAREVLLANLLRVANCADISGLGLWRVLTDGIFAYEVRRAAVSCVAEMPYAAEGAGALLEREGVES